jgi:predicted amidophosphoribosyltransferase
MTVCLACGRWGSGENGLCPPCRVSLVRAPSTLLPSGLVVDSGFVHQGAARRLVHRLKYGGLVQAGALLGEELAPLVPPAATAVVPVPRARLRRATHGIDPAEVLAATVAARRGLPLVTALRAGLWWPRHAGRGRAERTPPPYRVIRRLPPGAVLIDDVLTTGATLQSAAAVLGVAPCAALTATVAR